MTAPSIVFPPLVYLKDAERLGLPSKWTLLQMHRDEGLPIHRHPTRGQYVVTAELVAHHEAMESQPVVVRSSFTRAVAANTSRGRRRHSASPVEKEKANGS